MLRGEEVNESTFEGYFEYLAGTAFHGIHEQGTWYDGFILQKHIKRKACQIKLIGKIWVDLNQRQWLEPCEITITDKTVTKQGILVNFKIANNEIEKLLDELWPAG